MTRSRLSAATFPAPVLRPGDVVEIECTDLIAKTGQAVGRADGMVVYVLGPIPGERARVRIEAVKAKYAVGELVELLNESPERETTTVARKTTRSPSSVRPSISSRSECFECQADAPPVAVT